MALSLFDAVPLVGTVLFFVVRWELPLPVNVIVAILVPVWVVRYALPAISSLMALFFAALAINELLLKNVSASIVLGAFALVMLSSAGLRWYWLQPKAEKTQKVLI